jgi:hypothetical protein
VTSLDISRSGTAAGAGTMFAASRRMTLLDYFRVPYEIDPGLAEAGAEQLRIGPDGPSLFWTRECDAETEALKIGGRDGQPEIPIFARLGADPTGSPGRRSETQEWRAVRTLIGADGSAAGAIWQAENGSVFLPFDPDEVILNFWSERYAGIGAHARVRRVRRVLRIIYYRLRPVLPRSTQIWMRRRFARQQARCPFPRWPIEPGLHDFFDLMFAILADLAGAPVPRIAAWPNGYEWALVLTHDVEKAKGLEVLGPVIDIERTCGLRSSWNLVAADYEVNPEHVRRLVADGFEVGVHGMHHDGRDMESFATWQERLPGIRKTGERWGAAGFRAPSLHRPGEWMRLLGFEYDSSFPDSDPFEPQDGGCCTWLPFFNGELVELPMTLTMDHTLFVILCQTDETAWVEKTKFLRERGGMALINTHPDYLVDEVMLSAYAKFLTRFATDEVGWKALPREVSSWWRRRAESSLEHDGTGWRVVGPAAEEGRVEFVGGGTW